MCRTCRCARTATVRAFPFAPLPSDALLTWPPFESPHPRGQLTTLSLDGNGIADEGAKAIATALKANKHLTALSLRSNRITSARLPLLATALSSHEQLASLDLAQNEIGFAGAAALAAALEGGEGAPALERLLLDDNLLCGDAVWRLASAACHHRRLETISLRGLRAAHLTASDAERLHALACGGSPTYELSPYPPPLAASIADGAPPAGESGPGARDATLVGNEVWLARLGRAGLFC